jgi:hypothetical protein
VRNTIGGAFFVIDALSFTTMRPPFLRFLLEVRALVLLVCAQALMKKMRRR